MARIEAAHLLQAQRHIAGAEARIAKQRARIARLNEIGGTAELAEALLARMEAILTNMRWHQTQIEIEMFRIDRSHARHRMRRAAVPLVKPHDRQIEATLRGSRERIAKSEHLLARFTDKNRRSTLP